MIKNIGFILFLVFASVGISQAGDFNVSDILEKDGHSFNEGEHYFTLDMPMLTSEQDKIEVVELFGYTCPHCNTFDPFIENWQQTLADDVNFVRVPVVFGRSWEPMARAYYASEIMGTLDKTHKITFDALHKKRLRFKSPEDLANFYAKAGIDPAKFTDLYNSFVVNAKLKQSDSKVRGYGIEAVPALVVDGKYRVNTSSVRTQEELLDIVNFLVEKERKARAAAK